jgi:hypothetical protein
MRGFQHDSRTVDARHHRPAAHHRPGVGDGQAILVIEGGVADRHRDIPLGQLGLVHLGQMGMKFCGLLQQQRMKCHVCLLGSCEA